MTLVSRTYHRLIEQREDGFTFVEVMVALAVLGISIAALVGLLVNNTLSSARAADKSRVTDAMSQLADQLRALPYKEAGTQKTYVSDDGVQMSLAVSTSKTDSADVKVITITGVSNRLTPNTTQKLEVVLRNPSMGTDDQTSNEGDDTVTNPPVISSVTLFKNGLLVSPSDIVSGAYYIHVIAFAGDATKQLASISVSSGGQPIGTPAIYPASGSLNRFVWSSNTIDTDGKTRWYPDGISDITVEVKDDSGGYARKVIPIVIDNDPVISTFPNDTISVFTTNGISVSWNAIVDPANGKSTALRYKVILDVYKKNGTFIAEYSDIVTGSSFNTLPPTTYNFNVGYSKSQTYLVRVYAMCPPGCSHFDDISSSYLWKRF